MPLRTSQQIASNFFQRIFFCSCRGLIPLKISDQNKTTPKDHYDDLFEKTLDNLNSAQRSAVNHIEGPLLVVAGPGTGKTHLSAFDANKIKLPNHVEYICLGSHYKKKIFYKK